MFVVSNSITPYTKQNQERGRLTKKEVVLGSIHDIAPQWNE